VQTMCSDLELVGALGRLEPAAAATRGPSASPRCAAGRRVSQTWSTVGAAV
jgi:hypothetical protein